MADLARQTLDTDIIARCNRSISMLKHLANVVDEAYENKKGKVVYNADAFDALMHGATSLEKELRNLEYVRAVYDDKVHGGPQE